MRGGNTVTQNYTQVLDAAELESLPVFPLPRVVFFPGATLPLHLFEPRYRAMVEDCIEHGPRAMAVTMLGPGWEMDYDGRPPIHTIAGAGRIIHHQKRTNGTYDLLLQGMCRVKLEELPADDRPYRRAKATPLIDSHTSRLSGNDVAAMLSCVRTTVELVRRKHPAFALELHSDATPSQVADRVSDRLISDPSRRQELLETVDVATRVRRVTEMVGSLLATLVENDVNIDSLH